MGWNDLLLRLRALTAHRRSESELDEELNFHLEMEARKKQRAGMNEEAARQNARVDFGGLEQVREQCRDARGITFFENLSRDIRYGVRVLRKTPVFTFVAILSLAIGIGANTAVFSLVDAVLLRLLPVKNPQELVVLRWGASKGLPLNNSGASNRGDAHGFTTNVVSWRNFSGLREHSKTLDAVIGFTWLAQASIVARGQAVVTGGMLVSGNYFRALGTDMLLGRAILEDDDTADGVPAAVISYRFWEQALGLDPAVLGTMIHVNGQACTVVGITRNGFVGVAPGGFSGAPRIDVTLPARFRERLLGAGNQHAKWSTPDLQWVQVIGRLGPQRNVQAAESELGALIAANLPEEAQRKLGSEIPRVQLEPASRGLDTLRMIYATPLLVLTAVVGLTLLMACANLAGLLLARATARQKEIMLRLAVGAGRLRLIRQLLVEGALLAFAGAATGLAFAWWGVQALLALAASGSTPIFITVRPDARVLAFTAAVSLVATFLFALAPAIRATRVDVTNGLKEDSPMTSGARRSSGSRVLVTVQIAVAMLLVAGATLFTRTLANLRSLPTGFNTTNLVLFDIAPGRNGYDEARGNQVYARVLDRLRQTPGVVGASLAEQRLMTGWVSNGSFLLEGSERRKREYAHYNFLGPDFFRVMQIPLVMGRGIEQQDLRLRPRVAVINETLARESFGSGSPVGRRFRWDEEDEQDVEVIGVVKDAQYARLRQTPPPTIYVPYTQRPYGWPQRMSFQVRIAGNPAEAVARIRQVVREVDRMLPLIEVKTMEGQIEESLAQERLFAWLVSLFGGITLVLACVGLYGMVSYSVASRTREIGVRMALGAGRATVMRMVLRQVAGTTLAGLVIGLPAAVALARIVDSQLYGVKAHDPLSLAVSAAGILVVAWLAAFFPVRRAMGVDPVRALRHG